MGEWIAKLSSDPTWMFIGAMALVVLLFIVLVVVVSSMRVKSYKERFVNVQIDNEAKAKEISELQRELQALKIQNAKQSQELQQFAQIREDLLSTQTELEALRKRYHELEKLQSQTDAKLEHTEALYAKLQEEHRTFQERFDTISEENSKLRINNARLLMKLETEERQREQ